MCRPLLSFRHKFSQIDILASSCTHVVELRVQLALQIYTLRILAIALATWRTMPLDHLEKPHEVEADLNQSLGVALSEQPSLTQVAVVEV